MGTYTIEVSPDGRRFVMSGRCVTEAAARYCAEVAVASRRRPALIARVKRMGFVTYECGPLSSGHGPLSPREKAQVIAATINAQTMLRFELALECANNIVTGADAPDDDGRPVGMQRAIVYAMAHRIRTRREWATVPVSCLERISRACLEVLS